ncbi:MAG: 4Fe-4S binding protein [Calditerrivibrio sp.]|nr:4Fe-4S binding protein [Calditerrivibrio sp.]
MLRKYRRIVQLIIFLGMFIVPVLNIFEIYFIKGTFYSIDIGDIAIADPLAILQAIISSKTVTVTMLVSVLLPLLMMLVLGRVWCSWMCPYYFIVEILDALKIKLGFKYDKPKYHPSLPHKTNTYRFLLLLLFIFLSGIAGIPLLNLISAPGIISSQALVLVKFHYITFEAFFILVLLILELFYFRFWCRFFCPQGIFLSVFKFSKGLRIAKVKDLCSNCLSCVAACPMILNPMKEGNNFLCHNCGDCIDACPDNKKADTLKFRI